MLRFSLLRGFRKSYAPAKRNVRDWRNAGAAKVASVDTLKALMAEVQAKTR